MDASLSESAARRLVELIGRAPDPSSRYEYAAVHAIELILARAPPPIQPLLIVLAVLYSASLIANGTCLVRRWRQSGFWLFRKEATVRGSYWIPNVLNGSLLSCAIFAALALVTLVATFCLVIRSDLRGAQAAIFLLGTVFVFVIGHGWLDVASLAFSAPLQPEVFNWVFVGFPSAVLVCQVSIFADLVFKVLRRLIDELHALQAGLRSLQSKLDQLDPDEATNIAFLQPTLSQVDADLLVFGQQFRVGFAVWLAVAMVFVLFFVPLVIVQRRVLIAQIDILRTTVRDIRRRSSIEKLIRVATDESDDKPPSYRSSTAPSDASAARMPADGRKVMALLRVLRYRFARLVQLTITLCITLSAITIIVANPIDTLHSPGRLWYCFIGAMFSFLGCTFSTMAALYISRDNIVVENEMSTMVVGTNHIAADHAARQAAKRKPDMSHAESGRSPISVKLPRAPLAAR